MEKDKAKVIEIVGTASERAGSFVGKAAAFSKRVSGIATGSVSAGKGMLGLAEEDAKPAPKKKSGSTTKAVVSKSDLAAIRQQLAQAEKANSQLEFQIETLQKKNDSLVSELEQALSKVKEITDSEGTARARAAALESELEAASQQLEQATSKADDTKSKKPASTSSKAKLEAELASTRRKSEELRSQAESTQAELMSQVEKLQSEKDSLISELQIARSQVDEAKAQANSMKTNITALESELTILRSESAKVGESESDNNSIQIEEQNSSKAEEEVTETTTTLISDEDVVAPTGADTKPVDNQINEREQEQIDINVENVEELELKSETGVQPEITPARPAKVTAEDVRAADFKNDAERIVFSKALSDFASPDATTRAEATVAIGDIHHVLSPRLIISHMVDERSAYVRQECIKALAALESQEGLSTIEKALADEAAFVRLAAVWGLYHLAGSESIPALIRMLSDDDECVRRRAVTCIGWACRQSAEADNHHSKQVISALIQCLNDSAKSVIKAALDALGAVRGKKIGEPVLEDQNSLEPLIEQWRSWWKVELLR